jgi:hypothetical protein
MHDERGKKDSDRGEGRRTSRQASEVSLNEISSPAKVEKQKIVSIVKSRREKDLEGDGGTTKERTRRDKGRECRT